MYPTTPATVQTTKYSTRLIQANGSISQGAANDAADVSDYFGTTQTQCLVKGNGFSVWSLQADGLRLNDLMPSHDNTTPNPTAAAEILALTGQVIEPLGVVLIVQWAPIAVEKSRKMPAGEKRLRALSEQVKQHLVSLGCSLLSEAEKCRFYDWEVTLPTDAGKLSISVSISRFELYKTECFMVHSRFEKPELFPAEFCQWNHINPYSGKWNHYVTDGKPDELTAVLREFSRMIPILDATPELV